MWKVNLGDETLKTSLETVEKTVVHSELVSHQYLQTVEK